MVLTVQVREMTESYVEKSAFIRVYLSTVRVIVTIIYVHLLELLCQKVMKWILAIKHLLPGMCGHVCLVVTGIKCHGFLSL
jgi:hypothetical protein